jgi:hypothetical protein
MAFLLAGLAVLAVFYFLGRAYANADPKSLVRSLRFSVGGGLLLFGIVLMVAERAALGSLLIFGGLQALATGRLGPFDLGARRRSSGTGSTVKSAWIEMQLDHDSGKMTGKVLRGRFAGQALATLDRAALLSLAAEVGGDSDSVALLEAYLDRRFPGWREDVERDRAARPRGAADSGAMTDQQAYEILGLAPGAGEAEIRAAHRRLMKRVHPDQGGSTFLAAKLNQAKDWLLNRHR